MPRLLVRRVAIGERDRPPREERAITALAIWAARDRKGEADRPLYDHVHAVARFSLGENGLRRREFTHREEGCDRAQRPCGGDGEAFVRGPRRFAPNRAACPSKTPRTS